MIKAGTTLDGYRVERPLGRGGNGIVYEATQLSLDRPVALKVLRGWSGEDEEFAGRLRREGTLQASIEHPHVLDVYEVGESEYGLFLAMRLIEGGVSLADLLASGDLDAERALELLGQAASALDAAHAAGLVHGDVKPQNILVGDGDSAYLADFGLTRAAGDTATASRPLLGTVAYVAPEIVEGDRPGPASDRYSFAATAFHCLTGDPPFPLGSDAAVMYAHVSAPPPRASERRAELPGAVDGVLAEALAKDPGERPASAERIVDSVREALGPEAVRELGPPSPGARADAVPPTRRFDRASAGSATPSRRTGLIAVALVAAAAVGGGVALLLDGGSGDPEVPVPPVAASAEALGSSLPEPERSVDCRGQEPGPDSVACSIAQTRLPGAELVAPADGKVVGWAVRGASGEMALDVIRPRGPDTVRVGRSQFESAGNAAPHYFRTELPVERGDLLALQLGAGASIGVRDADDAATERWLAPEGGFYGLPDRREGSGFDHEVMLRADFVPGGRVRQPPELLGGAAARAPAGTVRKRIPIRIDQPPARIEVAAVEVGNRVFIDVFEGGVRRARMLVPGLLAGGQPVDMLGTSYEGEGSGEVGLWWTNPNSGRSLFHFFNVFPREIEQLG